MPGARAWELRVRGVCGARHSWDRSVAAEAQPRIAAHHRATRQVLCVPGRPAGWGLGSTAATESRADISSPGFLLLAFSNLLQKSPTNV